MDGGRRSGAGAHLGVLLAGLLGLLAGGPGCNRVHTEPTGPRPSVVIVIDDALRRDRLGAHGGPAHTPAFDAFAREHLLFQRAFTQAPWTKPSVATLFTSLYPSQHGVASDPALRAGDAAGVLRVDTLPDELVTLAEVFQAAGYRTAAFVSNPWLDDRYGFAQGFDHYDDSFARWGSPGSALTARARAWLAGADAEGPFLLYLHYLDSHRPHPPLEESEARARAGEAPAPGDVRAERMAAAVAELVPLADGRRLPEAGIQPSLAHLHRAYDKGVERFDRELGALLEALAAHPGWDRTLVFVTSDHGEALYERGYGNHGYMLHDEELAIPLAARIPGVGPGDVDLDAPVGLVDLLPTLCGHLALACPEPVFGRDLLRDPVRRYEVSEGSMIDPRHRAIRDGDWKLIWEPDRRFADPRRSGPFALYDLRRDPHETRDRLAPGAGDAESEAAFSRLSEALGESVAPWRAPRSAPAEMAPEEIERLRALGYLE